MNGLIGFLVVFSVWLMFNFMIHFLLHIKALKPIVEKNGYTDGIKMFFSLLCGSMTFKHAFSFLIALFLGGIFIYYLIITLNIFSTWFLEFCYKVGMLLTG